MSDEIITASGQGYEITPIGIRWTGAVAFEDWQRLGLLLRDITVALPWCVGDWMNHGEGSYGERASQAVDATDWKLSTIQTYAWVCRSIPPELRRPGVAFGIHQLVAGMTLTEQKRVLELAEGDDLTLSAVKRRLDAERGAPERVPWVMIQCRDWDDAERIVAEAQAQGRRAKIAENMNVARAYRATDVDVAQAPNASN